MIRNLVMSYSAKICEVEAYRKDGTPLARDSLKPVIPSIGNMRTLEKSVTVDVGKSKGVKTKFVHDV